MGSTSCCHVRRPRGGGQLSGGRDRRYLIPIWRTWDAWGALKVWHHVRGADVVHAQDRRAGLWVRLAPRPRRAGLRVYTIHGLPDAYLPPPIGRVRPGARASPAYRGVDVALSRRADAVIVPSHAVARLLTTSIGFPRPRSP